MVWNYGLQSVRFGNSKQNVHGFFQEEYANRDSRVPEKCVKKTPIKCKISDINIKYKNVREQVPSFEKNLPKIP